MKKWILPLGLAGALLPAVLQAPRPVRAYPQGVRTVDDAIANCRATGLEGWELVEYAQQLVHAKFTRYSILNLWESPTVAFQNSRGYCSQYNGALFRVLTALGFTAERVFATRVRSDDNPWWRMGHSWVRVTIDRRTKDVCAGWAENKPGEVRFVPVTDPIPFRTFTYWNTNNAMIVLTVYTVWKALLKREPLPRWMYRPFGEPVAEED